MFATLSEDSVELFVRDGYLKLDSAFDETLAARCREVLWSMLDVDRNDPSTWTQPVIRIPGSVHPELVAAINTPRLVGAVDDLLGPHGWLPRTEGYGTFAIRFPSDADPGDAGWHIDGSFGDPPSYRVNYQSRGRALLLLMLFSNVTESDAPTRIKVGSHIDVARALQPVEARGVVFLPNLHAPESLGRETAYATGRAGDVFLCHPFLVHAASWPHRGQQPRFIAQPCIHHPKGEWLGGFDYDDLSLDCPVKRAVRGAVAKHCHYSTEQISARTNDLVELVSNLSRLCSRTAQKLAPIRHANVSTRTTNSRPCARQTVTSEHERFTVSGVPVMQRYAWNGRSTSLVLRRSRRRSCSTPRSSSACARAAVGRCGCRLEHRLPGSMTAMTRIWTELRMLGSSFRSITSNNARYWRCRAAICA